MSRNVYGQPLQECSRPGMARSGFTRSGSCVDRHDDRGSHHVCLNLQKSTFCHNTSQTWCDQDMPCHEDSTKRCLVEDWCVCEWAFADHLDRVGGCDKVGVVDCHATNELALQHYAASSDVKSRRALECLVEKCNL